VGKAIRSCEDKGKTRATGTCSVVIPLYNGREYIGATCDSVAAQSHAAEELIVVDDCSTDDSLSAAHHWAAKAILPTRVEATEHNSGSPGKPTNIGISLATSEFIAVLDQDDEFLPDKLAATIDLLEKHPDLLCAVHLSARSDNPKRYGNLSQIRFARDPITRKNPAGDKCYVIPSDDAALLCLRHGMFASGYPGFVFRRSAWEQLGGVNEAMRIASDFDFLFALARLGNVGFIDHPLYRKRMHGNNLANNSTLGFLEVMQSIHRGLEETPELLRRPVVREALAWRIVETAWNVAAFGQTRLASRILGSVRARFGWTFERQLQTLAVPLLPVYRQLFMQNSRPGREDVFVSIESECFGVMDLMGPPPSKRLGQPR